MAFHIAFSNVLLTLIYILPGYFLCKTKKAFADHLSTMSAFLVYICSPCMIISSFLSLRFDSQQFFHMGLFFIVTLLTQGLFIAILYFFFARKNESRKYRVLSIASVFGNVGFFGLPIIKTLLPQYPEAACYSAVFTVSMNLLVFTVGIFALTGNKKYMSLRAAILNPSFFALIISLLLYIFGWSRFLPDLLQNGICLFGQMTTPLCMVILGVRLATVKFKQLFIRPFVYCICLLKLLIFPILSYALVLMIPVPFAFRASILILSGTPCAAIVLNMAEIYHSETELAANCVLLSTLLCVITIPLLTLICGQ